MTQDYGTYKILFPGERPEGGLLTVFMVFGPDDSTTKSFPGYAEATTWIDKQDAAKEKTKRRKLALQVISEKGGRSTITGIHASHGKVLTSPDITEKYGSGCMLPVVPWIESAIVELRETREHADNIEQCLRLFSIRPCDTYDSYNESKHEAYETGQ